MVTSVLPINPYAGGCTSVPMHTLVEVVCHACEVHSAMAIDAMMYTIAS